MSTRPRQLKLFRDPQQPLRTLTEDEIEALGVKYCGNLYYYFPDEVKALVRAIEKKLKGAK